MPIIIILGGAYGQPPQGPGGCPPGVDPSIYSWFQTVDADHSGQITANELQQALTNGNWSHFNSETCRLMIGEQVLLYKCSTYMYVSEPHIWRKDVCFSAILYWKAMKFGILQINLILGL